MRWLLSCFLLTICLTGDNAYAHQQKAALTKVLFNPRTLNIEVMHRFYVHDAEHAVKQLLGKQADILGSLDTQQKFSDYVGQHFMLSNSQGKSLALEPVGFEVDGRFFWVYQETRQPSGLAELVVSHSALRDIWPSQTNTVNIEKQGEVKTLTFAENVELLRVEF